MSASASAPMMMMKFVRATPSCRFVGMSVPSVLSSCISSSSHRDSVRRGVAEREEK